MRIIRKMKWALTLALVMALVVVGAALATVTVIDHFDVAQTLNLQCGGTLSTVSSVPDTEVLGDERDIVAQITFCLGSDPLTVTINNGGDSVYNYVSGNNIYGYSQIQWDGSNDTNKEIIDYEGLNGEDLTAGGTLDRFIIGTSSNDLPATLIITVYTNQNDWSTKTTTLPGGISGQNPQVFEVLFSEFDQTVEELEQHSMMLVQLPLRLMEEQLPPWIAPSIW